MAHTTASRALSPAARSSATVTVAQRVAAAFAVWRQRRALADLPEHLRRDVGLTEAEIERETRRYLWDVPNNWRY